jgi:hypothetical protein
VTGRLGGQRTVVQVGEAPDGTPLTEVKRLLGWRKGTSSAEYSTWQGWMWRALTQQMQMVIHHRKTATRPLGAKHEISNPKSETGVESSRDATFLSVVGADGNGEDFRKFFQATLGPFFATARPFGEHECAPDTACDSVIPVSYGDIDQV